MMPISKLHRWVFLAATLTLLSCGDNASRTELTDKLEQMKQESAALTKPALPEKKIISEPKPTSYQADTLREPFLGMVATHTDNISHPLQAYLISTLKFVGTITKDKINYAYLVTPDNMVYQVKVGDIIGISNGKVTHVYPDRIDILVSETTGDMAPVERTITLQLRKEP